MIRRAKRTRTRRRRDPQKRGAVFAEVGVVVGFEPPTRDRFTVEASAPLPLSVVGHFVLFKSGANEGRCVRILEALRIDERRLLVTFERPRGGKPLAEIEDGPAVIV
jgi:hypothetical protein